jgi:hypothetical protein
MKRPFEGLLVCATLFSLALASACAGQAAPRGKPLELFNGKDLEGWVAEGVKEYKDGDAVRPVWSVRDGVLFCDGKGFGFLRYARREFSDFTLHVEYRMVKKGAACNSGIGIRTVPFDPKRSTATRPSYACYEIQLLNDSGKPPTAHSSGSLYRYVAPSSNPVKPAPAWNVLDVECVGPCIRVTMNGVKVIDVDQTTIARVKNNPLKGYVCLQNHGGKIEFRNIRIQELKAPAR